MKIKMKKQIYSRLIIIISILMLILNGCSMNSDLNDNEWAEKNELVFGTTLNCKSLDPAKDYNGWFTVRYGVGETLFKLDDSMNPIPSLASSYKNIDDKTWSISINENINFQNGEKMTLDKVKSSLERTLEVNKRAFNTLKIQSIEIADNSLIITTSEANPTLINDLCDPFACIINVDSTEDFDNAPIGTGPFIADNFNPIKSSSFVKYDGYWAGEPKLDKVKVIQVSNSDTLTMALQSGEIDVAQGIPYSSVSLFENNTEYKVSSTDTSRVILMYYNYDNEILKDENVRKAINMSINKENYASVLLNGSAEASKGAFPESLSYGGSNVYDEPFNIEEAKKLLKASGYADSDNDNILEKDGKELQFKFVTYSSRSELPAIAQAVQADLKDIGINISVEISDNIMGILDNGDFDLALYSNVTASTGDPSAYLNNAMKSGGASNYGNYSNKEVDDLLEQLEKEFNPDKRSDLAILAQQQVLDDNAFDFIAHLKMSFVMKNNVIDFEIHPTDYYQINYKTDIV